MKGSLADRLKIRWVALIAVALFLCRVDTGIAGTKKSNRPNPTAAERNLLTSWDSLSDPRHHDPANYLYLVRTTPNIEQFATSLDIGLTKHILFSSLIGPGKHETFYFHTGIILKIKHEHVMFTGRQDSAVKFPDVKSTEEARSVIGEYVKGFSHPILLPSDLIVSSSSFDVNNEVILTGVASDGTPVRVDGFFRQSIRMAGFLIKQDTRKLVYSLSN